MEIGNQVEAERERCAACSLPQVADHKQLKQSILALESQRAILGEAVVDLSIAILREKLAALNQSVVTQTEQVGEHHIIRRADLKTYQSNYLNQGEKNDPRNCSLPQNQ